MLRSLVVIHRLKTDGKSVPAALPAGWFLWETCLRQIAVGFVTEGERGIFLDGWEIREGESGYRFLLEVITGLHSPIKGETEVLGQFRHETDAFLKRAKVAGFPKLCQALYRDAKQVRERFFSGAGSQSYGSVARRVLADVMDVHIVGAGQLALEILPWVRTNTSRSIALVCRDPKRATNFTEKFPEVSVRALADFSALSPEPKIRRALILAAPMSSAEAARLAKEYGTQDILLDFRADSASDPVNFSGEAITLSDVFAELSSAAEALASRGLEAEAAIALLARRQFDRVHYRPFGWEDVCA